jgi:hypothetical protein
VANSAANGIDAPCLPVTRRAASLCA